MQCSPVGIGQQAIEDGQVVAEGLAAGRRGDHGYVLAAQGGRNRFGLVRVECGHAPGGQRVDQAGMKFGRKWRVLCGLGGHDLPPGYVAHEARFEAQRLQGSFDRHGDIIARMRHQRNCDGLPQKCRCLQLDRPDMNAVGRARPAAPRVRATQRPQEAM